MIRLFVVFSVILFFSNCFDSKKQIVKLIADKDYKYWLVINRDKRIETKTVYRFGRDGTWIVFQKYPNGKFEEYKIDDIVYENKWSLINENRFRGGRDYDILALNTKVFVFSNENMEIITMIPAPDSMLVSNPVDLGKPKLDITVIRVPKDSTSDK